MPASVRSRGSANPVPAAATTGAAGDAPAGSAAAAAGGRGADRVVADLAPAGLVAAGALPVLVVARPCDVLAAAGPDAGVGLLGAGERLRAGALPHRADREAFLAAHVLVRYCVAAVAGAPVGAVGLVQQCPGCGSDEHGRPVVTRPAGLYASLAHSRGAVAVAVDRAPVGVDVEQLSGVEVPQALAAQSLSPAERAQVAGAADPALAFLRYWVRKESLVKAGALTLDDFSRAALDPGTETELVNGRVTGRFAGLQVTDLREPTFDAVVGLAGSAVPVVVALAGPAAHRG